MNKEIQDRWVENLESGQYAKGEGRLRDEFDNFCCLGVLTDMYIQETGGEWDYNNGSLGLKGAAPTSDLLPLEICEWAGIERDESHIYAFGHGSLAVLNDNVETFEPIIERIKDMD